MGPAPRVVLGLYIPPGDRVQAGGYAGIGRVASVGRQGLANSPHVVDRQENGDDDQSDGNEDDEEGLKVSQKEVGVEPAFIDYLTVLESEEGMHEAPGAGRGWFRPLAFWNQICLWFAGRNEKQRQSEQGHQGGWHLQGGCTYKIRDSLFLRSRKRPVWTPKM